eukprot:scaffold5538_cov159-Amphora_coffeaeformis.AAC.5
MAPAFSSNFSVPKLYFPTGTCTTPSRSVRYCTSFPATWVASTPNNWSRWTRVPVLALGIN